MPIGGIEGTGWRRDKLGLGLWPHQGKVAIVGWGNSPVDRRWDGVSMDKTYGAYALKAIKQALDDAGVKPEEVDGILACPETGAGATGGASADWGPSRPYFDPPYDSEWGLSRINAKWLIENMPELCNVEYAPDNVPAGKQARIASYAVVSGLRVPTTCETICITWEYFSTSISFGNVTVPGWLTRPMSFLPRSTSIMCSAFSFSLASSSSAKAWSSSSLAPRGRVPATG